MKATAKLEARLVRRFGRVAVLGAFESASQNIAEEFPHKPEAWRDLAAMRQAAATLDAGE